MTLGDLLSSLECDPLSLATDLPVTEVAYDSRRVTPGGVFVAITGLATDGHHFLQDAADRGAALAVVEHPVEDAPLPTLVVPDTRVALADLAQRLHDDPSDVLTLVGITGTNGKTTTAYQVESILMAAGHVPLLIGTVETRLDGRQVATGDSVAHRTTPEAPELQRLYANALREGASAGVMEVSSHALALERLRGSHFDIGVFTNLTRDHLDFHHTMEAYFEAKARLFDGLESGCAVINADDPWGQKLMERVPHPITFGIHATTPRPLIRPLDLVVNRDGIRFSVVTSVGTIALESPLVGDFNVYNLLAAVATGVALELSPSDIRRGIAAARAVPGRLERLELGQPYAVLVDYAHTPDALERLLETVRNLTRRGTPTPRLSGAGAALQPTPPDPPGQVIVVMGCGGDRDASKRAPMGVAAAAADRVIITADNPRSESAQTISQQVAEGVRQAGDTPYDIVVDRRDAIRMAIDAASAGDVLVIAGKGHETVQVIGNERIPFDDRKVAAELIRERL